MNDTETVPYTYTDHVPYTEPAFNNGDHTPAMEIIVRVTGAFTPAPRDYIGKHRKA